MQPRGPYRRYTKDMSEAERKKWWKQQADQSLLDSGNGRYYEDLGPEMKLARTRRKQNEKGGFKGEAFWYHQGHLEGGIRG